MAADDRVATIQWLDRAHRLVRRDLNVTLRLASTCLGIRNDRAAELFAAVAREWDIREALIGLAAARFRQGDTRGALEPLGKALRQQVVPTSVVGLIEQIARAGDCTGWCGVGEAGRFELHPFSEGPVELRLDGHPVEGNRLPPDWMMARQLSATLAGGDLLGSPIDLTAIGRLSGYIEAHLGGIRGWAWHPADPGRDPDLRVRGSGGGRVLKVVARDLSVTVDDNGPLSRPRGFVITPAMLRGLKPPFHVVGRDDRDLLGSPMDPWMEQRSVQASAAALARFYPAGSGHRRSGANRALSAPPLALPADVSPPARATGATRRRRSVDVIIPVHNRGDIVRACLSSVLATVQRPNGIIVVDDASSEPELVRLLDDLARARKIRLVRHARARGFPASANAGIATSGTRDVVLLNSDTLVPPTWLERLREAALCDMNTGTVTPFSNDASILSYPGITGSNPIPDLATTKRLDRAAHRANGTTTIEVPVGVGFCLYIRRDCLNAAGGLRDDVFAQGYGEENDFCLRARHLGWRHVAAPGVFVAHVGGASFGAAGRHLRQRNELLLNRLHPGYAALVEDFVRSDPLLPARRRLDLERWRAGRSKGQQAAILITHNDGGGVERQVAVRVANHLAAGRRAIVIRPDPTGTARPGVVVCDGMSEAFPNLRYEIPAELPQLLRFLRSAHPVVAEVHHLLGYHPAIYQMIAGLGVPVDVHVHDYAAFCPRISLVGGDNRYCGEPDLAGCASCIADAGHFMGEDTSLPKMLEQSNKLLRQARRVIAPSNDTATRMKRHFPGLALMVEPHEDDPVIVVPSRSNMRAGAHRVCVAGAIGVHKGYNILLACARDAAARDLRLEFVVVGNTIDDARLLATGRVFITGSYEAEEAVALIRAQNADLAFLPSIWPETWCLALTELWQAGLRVAAFDLGAPAERINRTGRGFLLPPSLPAGAINNALIAAAGLTDNAS